MVRILEVAQVSLDELKRILSLKRRGATDQVNPTGNMWLGDFGRTTLNMCNFPFYMFYFYLRLSRPAIIN